jgi:site-specific DNA-adenine methylase
MTAEQIETAYQETVKKVTVILDEDRKKNEEIDREVEKLRKQRETERKVFRKMREDFDKKNCKDDVMQVKEEGDG